MRPTTIRNGRSKASRKQSPIYTDTSLEKVDESPPSPVFLLDDSSPTNPLLSLPYRSEPRLDPQPLPHRDSEPELNTLGGQLASEDDWRIAPTRPVLAGAEDRGNTRLREIQPPIFHTYSVSAKSNPRSPTRASNEQMGHMRSPVLAREPTILESFSRTMRTYVPSSIRVPTSATSHARVSRPVSFGSSTTRSRTSTSGTDTEDVFVSEDEDEYLRSGRGLTSYPSDTTDDDGEEILLARWDTLARSGESPMQLLFLVYATGIQIWDCTNLSSVLEILNLSGQEWRRVSFAAVLPQSSPNHTLHHEKPLIGILVDGQLVVYSLSRHHIVTKLPFARINHFSANDHFIVISTTNPATLHVLSASSFIPLFTLPPSVFISSAPSSTRPALFKPSTSDNNQGVLSNLDTHNSVCVYAFSHRLLAYVSPAPTPSPSSSSPSSTHRQPRTHWKFQSADLSTSAIKVGESILAGVRTLGGLALNAAIAKSGFISGNVDQGEPKFFSRSAPTTSGQERRDSTLDVRPSSPNDSHVRPRTSNASSGHFVTVLDLAHADAPNVVAEFMASKEQPISNLVFSSDGTSLIVVPRDGQVLSVFRIRPAPPRTLGSADPNSPWHVYNLRRAITSGIVEGVEAARDFRWVAVGTRRRTVHIFAVNPYGGKPDNKSHLEGRVQNPAEMQPLSTEVSPLVRLRLPKKPSYGSFMAPLAFTFLDSSQGALPSILLPPATPHMRFAPLPSGEALSQSLSSRRPGNVQDLLVFDPIDGVLSLRRLTIELRSRDSFVSAVQSVGGTSVSLPGMGTVGRLGVSPPAAASNLTRAIENSSELGAKESLVATWDLKRKGNWGEIRRAIRIEVHSDRSKLRRADWLAQAELSTCSRSPRVLPRSIYLSHQFSFHVLGEDYHALIHRGQLDIPAIKLDVRKQVEISAYPAGTGESFVEGFAVPRAVRQASSSFDEPLASALAGGLDYSVPSQPIIPMLPNGVGSKPRSFKDSIPIRSMAAGLSDGMTERLGRIRRGTPKASPPPFPVRSDEVVPLEFDEEDEEDFPTGRDDDGIVQSNSRGEADSGASVSISTPSTTPPPLEDDVRARYGTDEWPKDETEDFDDISAVGYLDEEQMPAVRGGIKQGRR